MLKFLFPPVTSRSRWYYFTVLYIYTMSLYMITNRVIEKPAMFLPLTALDKAVPFMPWTGWIYDTVYLFPFAIIFYVDDIPEIKKNLISFLITGSLCVSVFFIFPTIYPRPEIKEINIASFALYFITQIDSPKNCFPSAHVAFAFLSAFGIMRSHKLWGNILLVGAVLVAISTLTTKQHYIWDVVFGYLIARVVNSFVQWARTPTRQAT